MDPVIRKRYEVVRVQDLMDYFAALHITPTCSQCEGTKFHIPTIRTMAIGPEGDPQNESSASISIEPYEMQGAFSKPTYYPLTCEFCGTILNVDALRILFWAEQQRQHEMVRAAVKSAADEVVSRHE